jgi:hypothetical protein
MKALRFFALFACMVAFAGCGNQPNDQGEYVIKNPNGDREIRIKYFSDGRIEYIKEFKNEVQEGVFVDFYKTGIAKDFGTKVNGIKDGTGVAFYPDGTANNVGIYKDDNPYGFFWIFDNHKNLVEKREYVTVKGKKIMNQWIRFNDIMQPVLDESNFIAVHAAKDTIKSGETYDLTISLEASFNKEYMALIIGPFDEQYNLPANSKCDTIVAKNFITTYSTKNYKTGLNTLRGVVKDLSYNESKDDTKIRSIYFTKEFLVRK